MTTLAERKARTSIGDLMFAVALIASLLNAPARVLNIIFSYLVFPILFATVLASERAGAFRGDRAKLGWLAVAAFVATVPGWTLVVIVFSDEIAVGPFLDPPGRPWVYRAITLPVLFAPTILVPCALWGWFRTARFDRRVASADVHLGPSLSPDCRGIR
jgi:hypothetical protein